MKKIVRLDAIKYLQQPLYYIQKEELPNKRYVVYHKCGNFLHRCCYPDGYTSVESG